MSVGEVGLNSHRREIAKSNLLENPSNIRIDVPVINKFLESGRIDLTIIHVEAMVNWDLGLLSRCLLSESGLNGLVGAGQQMVRRPSGLDKGRQEALSTGNPTGDVAIGSNTRLFVVGLDAVVRAVLKTLATGRRGGLRIVRLNRGDFGNIGRPTSCTSANLR
jgi:hypothetical protein